MKNLSQYLNESMIMELSSALLGLLSSAYFDYEDFDASYIVKSFDNIKDVFLNKQ